MLKKIQEKKNEKETVIIDEVTRTTVEDVRQDVESDSQLHSRDTGEPTEKRKRQAESAAELEDIEILKKQQEINAIAIAAIATNTYFRLKQQFA